MVTKVKGKREREKKEFIYKASTTQCSSFNFTSEKCCIMMYNHEPKCYVVFSIGYCNGEERETAWTILCIYIFYEEEMNNF